MRRAKRTHEDYVNVERDQPDRAIDYATRLVRDKKYRADTLQRLERWLTKDASERDATALVHALPASLFTEPHPHHEASKCFSKILVDARERLEKLEETLLFSSHFDRAWGDETLSHERDEDASRLIRDILSQTTLSTFKRVGGVVGVTCSGSAKHRKREELAVAEAIAAKRDKSPFLPTHAPSPLPTIKYLEELFGDREARSVEFARLFKLQKSLANKYDASTVMLFRAVAFARLFDWEVAADKNAKNATKKAHARWELVKGFEKKSKRDRLLAIGHLIHRNPVLCFQSVLTGVSRENGWQNGKSWTPLLFEAMLRDDTKMQLRCDALRDRYRHIIFLEGLDAPCIRSIPMNLRAIGRGAPCCVIRKSRCPGKSGNGLFAIADLPIGTSWLMGGVADTTRYDMDIYWEEQGVGVALRVGEREAARQVPDDEDDGVTAWKANEPHGSLGPNACYLSSPEGVYLTVCRPISATPERPQEIYVDYGENFQRNYAVSTRYDGPLGDANADEDWQCVLDVKALLAKSVHGIRPTQRHKRVRQ